MLTDEQIADALRRYREGRCTDQEKAIVERWFEQLQNQSEWDFTAEEESDIGTRIKARLADQLQFQTTKAKTGVRRILPYAAAAAVLLVLCSVIAYWLLDSGKPLPDDGQLTAQPFTDVAPGGQKAALTLAGGTTILLDSTHTGLLARQGNTRIMQLNNGRIAYKGEGTGEHTVLYNTLTTPRGGKYQLTLPDKSKVWLNAASAITFPTRFTDSTRKVKVAGEVYFEVAPDPSRPFEVIAGGMNILVLGTNFDVMAYPEDDKIKTTLLQGAVKIAAADTSLLLRPGQQLQMAQDGTLALLSDVNTDHVMAWKKGLFYFDRDDIHSVMNQLTRWYDIDIEMHGNIQNHFSGTLPQHVNVSEIFRTLEETGGIHFRIEDHKIIVSP